jgi:hypothetical protein
MLTKHVENLVRKYIIQTLEKTKKIDPITFTSDLIMQFAIISQYEDEIIEFVSQLVADM